MGAEEPGRRGALASPAAWALGALILGLVLLPAVAGRYPIYLAIQILILSVFAVGFNLLFGYSGLLSVRHTRVYFSMLTLAFGMMIYSVAWKWRDVTGGDDGLVGIPRAPLELPGLVSISLATMERYY